MLGLLVGTNHRPRTICRCRKEQRYGDPHVVPDQSRIAFRTVRFPSLPHLLYISYHPSLLQSSISDGITVNQESGRISSQRICATDLTMAQAATMPNAGSRADEKDITLGTHEDTESNDEKALPSTGLHGPTYENQGTDNERALIFKQDLRIIPLCSVCASALSRKYLY
jgi:hypothetical protein